MWYLNLEDTYIWTIEPTNLTEVDERLMLENGAPHVRNKKNIVEK
jgi:hypothetical protein